MEYFKNERKALAAFWREGYRDTVLDSAAVFGIIILVGFVSSLIQPAIFERLLNYFSAFLETIELTEISGSEAAIALFRNNISAAITTVCIGCIPFLFLSAFSLGFNAFLLGSFGAYYATSEYGLLAYFVGIVPHGIFELPALVLSCAAGLYLCRTLTRSILKRPDTPSPLVTIFNCFRVILFLVLPLMLLAAFAESYITPLLMKPFL